MGSVGAARTAIQIAVPIMQTSGTTGDITLEAAIQRVATQLYMRAHMDVPPDVIDMGGGLFNVVV